MSRDKLKKTGRTDEKDKEKRNCVNPEIGLHILTKLNEEAEELRQESKEVRAELKRVFKL